MRILITNDDGINSPALPKLALWARGLGEVTVVAPKVEQSGMSQAIDFHKASEIKKVDIGVDCEAYRMDSTPADCVRFATVGLHRKYDLVLSGINRGYNLGHDIVYSGTVGAIFEGARLGMKGIALSTDIYGFDKAFEMLDSTYKFILDNNLLDKADLLNVNFPDFDIQGISLTEQGGEFYSDEFVNTGNDMYIQVGDPIYPDSEDISIDINAVLNGYISITPLTEKRTDFTALREMRSDKQQ